MMYIETSSKLYTKLKENTRTSLRLHIFTRCLLWFEDQIQNTTLNLNYLSKLQINFGFHKIQIVGINRLINIANFRAVAAVMSLTSVMLECRQVQNTESDV